MLAFFSLFLSATPVRRRGYTRLQPRLWNDAGASKGLPEVVMDALSSMDRDTMAEMLGDVVVVGGSATFEGLGDRLEEELKAMLPEALATRVEVRVLSANDLIHRLVRAPRRWLKPLLKK